MIGDYINIMKTTFDLNFDVYSTFKSMDSQKMETKRTCQLKKILFNYL